MNNLQTSINDYLEYCQTQKRLDTKTLKAYRIDLRQFQSDIHAIETSEITSQMFRHTFATCLLEADVDIRYIQEMLGHSSINVTEIYTHVAMAKQKDILMNKHPRKDFRV